MKTSALLSLFAAAALVSGCRVYEDSPGTRRTVLGPSSSSSSASNGIVGRSAAKPASKPVANQGSTSSSTRAPHSRIVGETPVNPVAVSGTRGYGEEPVFLDDVGPSGRVRPKPATPAVQPTPPALQHGQRPTHGEYRPAAPAPAQPVTRPATPAPSSKASGQTGGAYHVYTVKPGDYAGAIAQNHQMTLAQLIALNPELKNDPNHLRVGQGLKVTSGTSSSSVSAKPAPKPAPVPNKTKPAPKPEPAPKPAPAPNPAPAPKPAPAPTPAPIPVPAPALDVDAPPPPPTDVVVPGTDSSIDDVLSLGLGGAKDRSAAAREAAEAEAKARAAAEKARLEAAQKEAEEAKRKADEALRKAQEDAARIVSTPTPAPAPAPVAGAGEYVVQPDDDIFMIALKFNVTPLALRKANGSDLSTLKPGQILKIPSKD